MYLQYNTATARVRVMKNANSMCVSVCICGNEHAHLQSTRPRFWCDVAPAARAARAAKRKREHKLIEFIFIQITLIVRPFRDPSDARVRSCAFRLACSRLHLCGCRRRRRHRRRSTSVPAPDGAIFRMLQRAYCLRVEQMQIPRQPYTAGAIATHAGGDGELRHECSRHDIFIFAPHRQLRLALSARVITIREPSYLYRACRGEVRRLRLGAMHSHCADTPRRVSCSPYNYLVAGTATAAVRLRVRGEHSVHCRRRRRRRLARAGLTQNMCIPLGRARRHDRCTAIANASRGKNDVMRGAAADK